MMCNTRLFSITFLVLTSVFSIWGCKVHVQQFTGVMKRLEKTSVSIPCSCNISSCSYGLDKLQISWYVFHKDTHHQIDFESQPSKYAPEGHNLKISSLTTKDCGVYYCAAALSDVVNSGTQAIGQGVILKVKERGLNVRQALLLTLLILLIVYSLLVVGIIICIKTGRIQSLFRGRWSKRKTQDRSRQVVFNGVVQELYKRNLVCDKIQTCHKKSQDKSHRTQDKIEDIYQNFDD